MIEFSNEKSTLSVKVDTFKGLPFTSTWRMVTRRACFMTCSLKFKQQMIGPQTLGKKMTTMGSKTEEASEDDYPDEKDANLVSWVRALIRKSQGSRAIDPKIRETGSEDQKEEALKIGYLCTVDLPLKRPSMRRIVGSS